MDREVKTVKMYAQDCRHRGLTTSDHETKLQLDVFAFKLQKHRILCLELQCFLYLMHGACAALQSLDLAVIQSLFDDANDTIGAQHAGKAQENFIFNSMKTLKKKKIAKTVALRIS